MHVSELFNAFLERGVPHFLDSGNFFIRPTAFAIKSLKSHPKRVSPALRCLHL